MARVRVRYFGILREKVGKREERVTIEDSASLSELIDMLIKSHGEKFTEYAFDSDGHLKSGFAFAINGDSIRESELPRIKCKQVSEFVILPPISGGAQIRQY